MKPMTTLFTVAAIVDARRMRARAHTHMTDQACGVGASANQQYGLTRSDSRCRRGIKDDGNLQF